MNLKPVYALVGDLFFASKIVKTAQALELEVRVFDSAARLLQASREKEPMLVLLDCQGLEREAFHLLGELRSDTSLSAVPRIGYLSHVSQDLRREMREAGCEQVYPKSTFTKELENLLARYSRGLSSRI